MQQIANFEEAHEVLKTYIPQTSQREAYTLERMTTLMEKLGNPQNKLKIIHVAGTSGKTSTCYYVASLLQQAGQKVGLTVSPHIDQVNERVQINLVPLSEAQFCHNLTEFLKILNKLSIKPTYFELLVAFAYWEFVRQKVDYAVVEVGLGGLLDGTNVAGREDKICVITDIGFDHMHVLGNELNQISGQKAGIIYPKNQVFMHKQKAEITDVIQAYANKQDASLNVLSNTEPPILDLDILPVFQRRNWLLAFKVYDFIQKRDALIKLTGKQMLSSLSVKIPARMEEYLINSRAVILDGAHNSQKTEAFVKSFQTKYPNKKAAILLSLKEGKDYRAVLPLLKPICSRLIITAYETRQDLPVVSMNPHNLAEAANNFGYVDVIVEEDYNKALDILLGLEKEIAIITGSFYLISCVKPKLARLI